MEIETQAQPKPDLRLLGSLRFSIGEPECELAAPMHLALLAILAINANTVVSTEQLIDELWSREPPDGARATLQSYVSVLRRKCREAGRSNLIVTRSPGYVLRLEADEIDVAAFRSHIGAAQQADAAAAEADQYRHLAAALALIHGPVLPALSHLDTVRVFINDIDEHRRWATRELVELDMRGGRAADVIPRLRKLIELNPLEEGMWGLLMRALYRCGRQADALRAYQELRTLLLDELGIEPSAEVRAIESDILQGELVNDVGPARRQRSARRTAAAPHAMTPLIGRVAELVELETNIGLSRLATVTGPGGCGKTRLASEVAHTVAGHFEQVAWVELDNLAESAKIDEAIAAALGVFRRQADGLLDRVVDELAGTTTLLILDNCEHVLDSAAAVVEYLLATCPGLTVVATSRERLMVAGESAMSLPPLVSASPLELARSRFEKPTEAALLFINRTGIDLPPQRDLALIEAICAQLDGIPLAIELAAPLAQVMTYDEIAGRLLDRFRLLGETHRVTRPQHRTLRAVVEWSHDLLEKPERETFAALSVFRGPFSLDAAREVTAVVGHDALTHLPVLVRKSVVLADMSGTSTRYRVLETLRAFAAEQLGADPINEAAAAETFVLHFAGQARRWARQQQTATVSAWLAELGPDIANFQAAVSRARETDVDSALTMVDAFQWFFNYTGQMPETRAWLREPIVNEPLILEQRAVATVCQASLANFSGDSGATGLLAEEALAVAQELGDERRLNAALIIRGTTAVFEGNVERAAECFIDSAQLSEALGDLGGIAASMAFWGVAHRLMGQFDDAKRCFDKAFEGFSRLADDRGMALVTANSGRLAHQLGDLDRGRELTRRGLEMARESLDPMVSA